MRWHYNEGREFPTDLYRGVYSLFSCSDNPSDRYRFVCLLYYQDFGEAHRVPHRILEMVLNQLLTLFGKSIAIAPSTSLLERGRIDYQSIRLPGSFLKLVGDGLATVSSWLFHFPCDLLAILKNVQIGCPHFRSGTRGSERDLEPRRGKTLDTGHFLLHRARPDSISIPGETPPCTQVASCLRVSARTWSSIHDSYPWTSPAGRASYCRAAFPFSRISRHMARCSRALAASMMPPALFPLFRGSSGSGEAAAVPLGGLGGLPPPPPGMAGESVTPPFARMRESTSRYDAPAGACAFACWYKASSFSKSYPLSFASPHVGT